MVLQQTPVLARCFCNVQCEGGSPPEGVFAPTPPPQARSKRDTHTFVSFATFCSSPLLPFVRNQDWPSGIITGSHRLANYAFVSFASFCLSPLFSLCEKQGLAFRDHHGLAQARKLYLRFPLLPSIQVLFSPCVRNQDWSSG